MTGKNTKAIRSETQKEEKKKEKNSAFYHRQDRVLMEP